MNFVVKNNFKEINKDTVLCSFRGNITQDYQNLFVSDVIRTTNKYKYIKIDLKSADNVGMAFFQIIRKLLGRLDKNNIEISNPTPSCLDAIIKAGYGDLVKYNN